MLQVIPGSEKFKCCDGSGVQRKLDGIKIYCPACQGSGECPMVNKNIKFPPNDLSKTPAPCQFPPQTYC